MLRLGTGGGGFIPIYDIGHIGSFPHNDKICDPSLVQDHMYKEIFKNPEILHRIEKKIEKKCWIWEFEICYSSIIYS